MNRSAFDLLPEDDKLSLIVAEGVLLAQQHSAQCRHFLYRLFDDFYVSVVYRDGSDNLAEIKSCEEPSESLECNDEKEIEYKHRDPASRIQENPED